MQDPITYLKQNPQIGKVLYYPGALTDIGLLELFIPNNSIDTVIYTDYNNHNEKFDKDGIEELFPEWRHGDTIKLTPAYFGKKSWEEFWPANPSSREFGQPENAYGYKYQVRHPDSDNYIDFIYLGTEAIQTYKILCENNLTPDVIVLQDHGTGGNWSFFGGDIRDNNQSPLYLNAINSLPEHIFVAAESNTTPWPGYQQVSDYVLIPPSQHARAIFKLKK